MDVGSVSFAARIACCRNLSLVILNFLQFAKSDSKQLLHYSRKMSFLSISCIKYVVLMLVIKIVVLGEIGVVVGLISSQFADTFYHQRNCTLYRFGAWAECKSGLAAASCGANQRWSSKEISNSYLFPLCVDFLCKGS